jgi:anti-sigma regulatory factor (Ser/Thr protein kinase)
MAEQAHVSDMIDLEVDLPRAKGAPQLARWVMRSWCADRMEADLLADAELAVSELASNAIFHGQGQITLRAWLDEHRLLVEVIDEGPGFERWPREREFGQIAGWGLDIVEDVCSRWGVHENPTDVWFELDARTATRQP